jgi:glycyl-tRNA synthetase
MKLILYLAPYNVCVLPLAKKYHSETANELFELFNKEFMCSYDDTGSIGKRYRRADAIGTPWCITVDDETINNGTVTVRDRDTMEQITLKIEEVIDYIKERVKF